MRHQTAVGIAILLATMIPADGDVDAAKSEGALARECTRMLKLAGKEMKAAKARGFLGGVEKVKAAGLIAAAQAQKGFKKYAGCVRKAYKAREYIRKSTIDRKKK